MRKTLTGRSRCFVVSDGVILILGGQRYWYSVTWRQTRGGPQARLPHVLASEGVVGVCDLAGVAFRVLVRDSFDRFACAVAETKPPRRALAARNRAIQRILKRATQVSRLGRHGSTLRVRGWLSSDAGNLTRRIGNLPYQRPDVASTTGCVWPKRRSGA